MNGKIRSSSKHDKNKATSLNQVKINIQLNDITNLFNFESPDYCFDIKYSKYARYCPL